MVKRSLSIIWLLLGVTAFAFAQKQTTVMGEAWRVGIQSPWTRDALVATVYVEDAAIATSGDYEQVFVHRNRRYHHLLDPRTAAPRGDAHHSVSVLAPTCMDADAGATTAFVMADADAEPALARHSARVVHTA